MIILFNYLKKIIVSKLMQLNNSIDMKSLSFEIRKKTVNIAEL